MAVSNAVERRYDCTITNEMATSCLAYDILQEEEAVGYVCALLSMLIAPRAAEPADCNEVPTANTFPRSPLQLPDTLTPR